jgi:protein-tyrosine-phosphatase
VTTNVLFVCEHGSAKSVVAAAHFDRLAKQRGLSASAFSRGTSPDDEIHPAALRGLERDHLVPREPRPLPLTQEDLDSASSVITFCDIPSTLAPRGAVQRWSVAPISEDYEASRTAILEQIERLLAGESPG